MWRLIIGCWPPYGLFEAAGPSLTCLSFWAVGAHHLSRLCNLSTAALVRARAGLTIDRSANQSVAVVTILAALAGRACCEVGAFAHAWNRDERRAAGRESGE